MTDIFKSADWAREEGGEVSGVAVVSRNSETIETILRHEVFLAILRHLESADTAGILTTPLARDLTDKVMKAIKAAMPPPIIPSDEALRILNDPAAMREMMRPDGYIVIKEDDPIPSVEALNKARGLIMRRTMSREEAERYDGGPAGGSMKDGSE